MAYTLSILFFEGSIIYVVQLSKGCKHGLGYLVARRAFEK